MERNQLIYTITVADTGSITRAAEKLHISQPSLSNQIIHLERELGVPLFERVKKRVYLTAAGLAFVEQARQIINQFQSLEYTMTEYAQNQLGHVHVGALSIMCPLQIPDLVQEFRGLYPGIQVSLLESGSIALLQALAGNEIDVAFALLDSNHAIDESLQAVRLMDSDIYAVVSKNHALSGKQEITLNDLTGMTLIMNTSNFRLSSIITSRMEAAGIHYTIGYSCNQIDSCLSLAGKNLGVFFCSRETALYYQHDHLELLRIQPPIKRGIYLLYKKNPDYHPALRSFIQYTINFYKRLNNEYKTPAHP